MNDDAAIESISFVIIHWHVLNRKICEIESPREIVISTICFSSIALNCLMQSKSNLFVLAFTEGEREIGRAS